MREFSTEITVATVMAPERCCEPGLQEEFREEIKRKQAPLQMASNVARYHRNKNSSENNNSTNNRESNEKSSERFPRVKREEQEQEQESEKACTAQLNLALKTVGPLLVGHPSWRKRKLD